MIWKNLVLMLIPLWWTCAVCVMTVAVQGRFNDDDEPLAEADQSEEG